MFKRTALFLCLIFVLLTTSGFALTGSFRSAATGDLLYGDFDNDLDPVYIWDNDGYRIYSTLSNLSTNLDEFVGGTTGDDAYLFGVSGRFGLPEFSGWQSRTMFLVELADSRSDFNHGLDTDFDGVPDEFDWGYMSGDGTTLRDNNGDNIFDTRGVYTSAADQFELKKNRDWSLIHSYKRNDTKIGFSFSNYPYGTDSYREYNYQNTPFEIVTPAHTYSYSNRLVQTDLSSQQTLENRSESADFSTIHEAPTKIFRLALETPFSMISNSEIRFDFSYEKRKNEHQEVNSYSYYRDVSSGGMTDITSMTETLQEDSCLSGNIITPGLRLTKHWDDNVESWFDVGLGFGNFDANGTYADRYDEETQLPLAGNTEVNTWSYDNLANVTGETKHKSLWFHHKTVVDFTEKFTFAAGLGFSRITDETDWEATYSTFNRLSTDNGDAVSDANDYVRTTVASSAGNYTEDTKRTMVSLPVAMEYALGRWTFRLGAEHTIGRQVNEINDLVIESDPTVTTTIYGDNDTTITTANNEFLSLGNATESRGSSTNFVYGLQFKANDNLKIELLQYLNTGNVDFINTDFYQQLRLSLTVLL